MTSYFVYHAHSDTATLGGMPNTSDIVQATRGGAVSTLLAGAQGLVHIIGPTPRIVRSTTIGSLMSGYHTDVAELIGVDNDAGTDPLPAAQAVADTMTQQLQDSDSSWQTGTIVPWNQATNGLVSWWQCAGATPESCASVTMTRDGIQQGAARANQDENPIGPTSAASGPGSILPTLPSVADTTELLKVGGIVLAGLVGLYLLWPALSGARTAAVQRRRYTNFRYARRNPEEDSHARIQRWMKAYVQIKSNGRREYVYNSAIPVGGGGGKPGAGVWYYWTQPIGGGRGRREQVVHSVLRRTVES